MEIPEMEALVLGKSSINGNTIPRININLQLEVVR
jgi:chemotaxis signal transduction protein